MQSKRIARFVLGFDDRNSKTIWTDAGYSITAMTKTAAKRELKRPRVLGSTLYELVPVKLPGKPKGK